MQDVFNRQGERVGVIEYETYGDMENALRKLDDADLKGNRVRVVEEVYSLNLACINTLCLAPFVPIYFSIEVDIIRGL